MSLLKQLNNRDEQRAIEMLDSTAKSDIEIYCRAGEWEGSGLMMWIDITALPDCPMEKRTVENAIWWCQLRGLFIRHPSKSNFIRFNRNTREQYEKQSVAHG